jgi:hypothetical protein
MKCPGAPAWYQGEPFADLDLVTGSCRLSARRLLLDLRMWGHVNPAVPGENLPSLYHPTLPDLVQSFSE